LTINRKILIVHYRIKYLLYKEIKQYNPAEIKVTSNVDLNCFKINRNLSCFRTWQKLLSQIKSQVEKGLIQLIWHLYLVQEMMKMISLKNKNRSISLKNHLKIRQNRILIRMISIWSWWILSIEEDLITLGNMSFNTLSDACAYEGSHHVQIHLKDIGIGTIHTKNINNLTKERKNWALN